MTDSDEQPDQEPPQQPGRRSNLRITLTGCPEGMQRAVRRAARLSCESCGHTGGRLDIAMLGDTGMRRQNAQWRGVDSPTDVLAFDLRDDPADPAVDGQLLVCKSVARREARARRTDWRGELLLYVVHGCLHLCGHDDRQPAGAARMHRREDEILTALGWGPVFSGDKTNAATGRNKRPVRRISR